MIPLPKKYHTWKAEDTKCVIGMYDNPGMTIRNQVTDVEKEDDVWNFEKLEGQDLFASWAITWDTNTKSIVKYHNHVGWIANYESEFQWDANSTNITAKPIGGIKILAKGQGKGSQEPKLLGGPPNRDWDIWYC